MIKLKTKSFGMYQTNCYIVSDGKNELIIDPGVGASSWVKKEVTNPLAILNTHGHFDHIWSNCELKKELKIPIYIPKLDHFMLENDVFQQNQPVCSADFLIDSDKELKIENFNIKYIHFPGHTPGCSIIEINEFWFSGDFIFENSIGRCDFPYSNSLEMKKSLEKFKNIVYDKKVFPGHGNSTTIKKEQKNISYWLKIL